jgi:hypothetical protein
LIEIAAIEAMPPCKRALTSFAFNCCFQQANYVALIEHRRTAVQTGEQIRTIAVASPL